MSENCLYLNIWLHAKELWGKLPVIIWIYDGGLQFSATSEMQYNGTIYRGLFSVRHLW